MEKEKNIMLVVNWNLKENISQSTKYSFHYVAVSTQMLQILCFFIVFSCFILSFQFLSLFLQREIKKN